MANEVDKTLKLPIGTDYPLVGLGTFTIFNETTGKPGDVYKAVKYAIDVGYRHIDTAYLYGNEGEVGNALQAKLDDGTIKDKKEVFITTKLWVTNANPKMVRDSAVRSMKTLQVETITLYLMHWPFCFQDGDDFFPKDEEGNVVYSDHDFLDTWKAMEELVNEKLVENIGVSNFNISQLERLLKNCRIKPCNLQIEVHPYLANKKLVDFCHANEISVTAYAPFANPGRNWNTDGQPNILDDIILKEIALSKGKSIPQIVLRFLIQRKLVVIPKSVTKSRIKENYDVFDFRLTEDEMTRIFSLDRHFRVYWISGNTDGQPNIFDELILKGVAQIKGKNISQVVDFCLTEDEMTRIFSLDRNFRVYWKSGATGHKNYPFRDE